MTQDSARRRPGHALTNLVEAGRDLVHGAAGARPGSRRRKNFGGGVSQVSRWVGEGINWLLEDDPNDLTQEAAPWRESPPPIVERRSRNRPSRMVASDSSNTERLWDNQESDGDVRRRPLQVIPHPAPPLLQQAEPSLENWQEEPSSFSEPHTPLSSQPQSQPPRRRDARLSRPRPRSSRRIRT